MNKNAIGFTSGLCLGAGLVLLFTPKTGRRMRATIAKRSREGADYLQHQATAVRGYASDLIEKGQRAARRA
jgi:gas vesicle protein